MMINIVNTSGEPVSHSQQHVVNNPEDERKSARVEIRILPFPLQALLTHLTHTLL